MLIFDCDGVLVDSEAVALDAELAYLADAGLTYDRHAYVRRYMGMADPDWMAGLRRDHVEQLGVEPPDGFFPAIEDHVTSAVHGDLRVIDGAHAAVAAAPARAVASSSPMRRLRFKLADARLAELFGDAVFSADAVAHGKPAPDLFLHAAEVLGVEPAACTVVEDSVNGVRAGDAAGMRVVGFTGGAHCPPGHAGSLREAGADVVVAAHAELHDALAALDA